MTESDRALQHRLHRAEGQLRGISRMVEEGKSCEEVVAQLLAVRAAIERIAAQVITEHVDECLTRLPPEQARESVNRALKLLGRLD
jgi:DNA-binding FrmR family transcriptional regulator